MAWASPIRLGSKLQKKRREDGMGLMPTRAPGRRYPTPPGVRQSSLPVNGPTTLVAGFILLLYQFPLYPLLNMVPSQAFIKPPCERRMTMVSCFRQDRDVACGRRMEWENRQAW